MLSVAISHQIGSFSLSVQAELPLDGVSALFGPSGSGKTLTLRCIAGLERPRAAQLRLAGQCWQDATVFVPAHQRQIAYVPQDAGLFAHLSVRGNLAYALARSRAPRMPLAEAAARTQIADLLDRPVSGLSGGQRQRVALARALLAGSRLLLLDEPLSALDRSARQSLASMLRRLALEFELPMLLVSHSAEEVERLADRVWPIVAGQSAPWRTLGAALADPASPLHAEQGPASVFDALPMAAVDGDGLLQVGVGAARLWVAAGDWACVPPLRLRILARDVVLTLDPPSRSSALNVLPVCIVAINDLDAASVLVRCQLDAAHTLLAAITRRSARALTLAPGQTAWAQIKTVALG